MNLIQNRPANLAPAQRAVATSELRTGAALQKFKESVVREFRLFWFNAAASPQEQLAVMGNRAAAAFDAHQAAVVFLLSRGVQMEPEDYTPPLSYTRHEDGTITLQ